MSAVLDLIARVAALPMDRLNALVLLFALGVVALALYVVLKALQAPRTK